MSKWISVEALLPKYGIPVLISCNGVTQHVTYTLSGDGGTSVWFEPYYFGHDEGLKIWYDKVDYWQPLPGPPEQ